MHPGRCPPGNGSYTGNDDRHVVAPVPAGEPFRPAQRLTRTGYRTIAWNCLSDSPEPRTCGDIYISVSLALPAAFAAPAFAAVDLVTLPRREGTQLTIYNPEDITMVREHRLLTVFSFFFSST